MRKRFYSIWVLCVFFLVITSCSTENTPDYTISTSSLPSEAGSVSPSTTEFKKGEEIMFEAQPNEEWVFIRWEGASTSTDNPVTILVTDDAMLRAVFEKKQYSLEIITEGEGEVTEKVVTAKDYDANATVEVEAIPDEGWNFLNWSGDLSGSENPQKIQMDSQKSVVANFEIETFPLRVTTEGEGNVMKTPDKEAYDYSASVELQAKPSEGWQFERWESDLTGSENPASITIMDTTNVRAVFSRTLFDLIVTSSNGGSVDVSQLSGEVEDGQYSRGSEMELLAQPKDGFKFDGWHGNASGTENPLRVIVEDDTYIQANFSRNCSEVVNCISTDFYAATISGGRVQKGGISMKNNLPDNLTLNKIRGRDEEGNVIGQEDGLGIVMSPGESLDFSYPLDPEPLLDDFLKYKIEFFFEYNSETYKVTQKANETSPKDSAQSEVIDGDGTLIFRQP